MSQVLIRIRIKDKKRLDHRVRRSVDNGDVARALMRNREHSSKVDLLAWCVLLNISLVVGELSTLAQTDVALGRAIARYVLEWAGTVGVDGCDGGLTTDLCHRWAR